MNEQRLSERLINYWNNIRKDAPLPDFAHFNKSTIEDIWQQCVLFVIMPAPDGKPPRINFYTVGEKIRTIYGEDMTGHTFSPPLRNNFQGAAIIRKVPDVIANPVPITDEGQFVNDNSKVVKYRSCLLPFGRNEKVTHILAGISWRVF